MKKLLPILFVLIISSCSKEVPSDQLVERGGVYYEVNSQTGFTGTSISYYENGQIQSKESFKKGKPNGPFETYFENGQIKTKGEISRDGWMYGKYENYYENGQLKDKGTLKEDGSLVDGDYITFHENGLVMSKSNIKNNELDGYVENFFDNGQLEEKKLFLGGIRQDGTFERFDKNGQFSRKGTLKNNKLHGLYEIYDNGKLSEVWTYDNGNVNGQYKSFHSDGKIKVSGIYISNELSPSKYFKNGIWKSFYNFGDLRTQESYKRGKKHGVWISFRENGKVIGKYTFIDDQLDGLHENYDPISEVLKYRGFFKNNLPHGEWEQYWSNGNIRDKGKYENGLKIKPWELFDIDGQLEGRWDDSHSSRYPIGPDNYIHRLIKDIKNGRVSYYFD